MSRSLGSRRLTTRPAMSISPPVMGSSPATMRSSVDLPQPEGPTMTMNSPSATSRSMPWITCTVPYCLVTLRNETVAMVCALTGPVAPPPAWEKRAGRGVSFLRVDEALHEPSLHQQHHQRRRQHREHRGGHDEVPFGCLLAARDEQLDADHGGVHVLLGRDQERPQVLVPAVDEQDHEQRGHVRPRQRDHDVLQEAQRAGAVDARGLGELLGNGEEKLAEEEGRGGRRDERYGESRV